MDIPTSPSGHGFVSLSSCGFAFWWLIIFFVHLTTFAYNACFALFYWNVDDLYLMFALASHGIGMPSSDFRTISYVHMALAGVHGFYVVQMVLGSAKRCTLAFSLRPKKFLSDGKIPNESENPVSSIHDENNTSGENLWTRLKKVFGCITRKSDELSVNGKYFHGILICRELVESSLQTMQAIRMSRYLSHPYLNHFYVGLLAINCWSSVIIYSRWFWDDEAYRRFALVMCDCALDLMSTVGVAVLIVLSYIGQYDVRVNGFGVQILDDEWFAKMMNEAQVVLVTSWSDLVIRVIFSLGLLGATGKMKELLHCTITRSRRVATDVHPPSSTKPKSIGSLFTIQPSVIKFQNDRDEKNYNEVISPSFRIWNKSRRNRLLKMVHILIATWGMVVLALHIDASLRTQLIECNPKVHPMAGALPSCFVVNFDCYRLGISGLMDEVKKEWERFDHGTVEKLQILHCSAMEVPTHIQQFHHLREIYAYNTTFVKWDANAALSGDHHPKLGSISIARSNMTGGLLPLGLHSKDFPSTVFGMYFVETNLKSLPDDLDSKWPRCAIYIENSLLTDVPPSLMRLQPSTLSLAGNPIRAAPKEIFESGIIQYTSLSRTLVCELPQNVSFVLSYATQLELMNTSISFFWAWIDPLAELALELSSTIFAGGSTYCFDLEKILSGTASTFSEPFQAGHSTLLMNASEANWDILRRAVDCTAMTEPTTPRLAYWDQLFALGA